MVDKLSDELADETISGLKGFFTHRIDNGEDPTTYLQMFLNFLESNKDKNPQLFRKIVSKIDYSFFAPLKNVNRIASPDDFVTTYHNLVSKLIEINSETPYKADYEKQKVLIEEAKKQVEDRLRKEKQEKIAILASEYNEIVSKRRAEFKKKGVGSDLREGAIAFFALFGICLLFLKVPWWGRAIITFIGIWLGCSWLAQESNLSKLFAGLFAGVIIWSAIHPGSAIFGALVVGVFSVWWYRHKVAHIELTPEERNGYDTSLTRIDKHFSDKGKYEIAQSTVGILATGDATLDLDKGPTIGETASDLATEESLVGEETTLRDHAKDVFSVSFSPDGKKLASGSKDKTIIIWDVATGEAERTLKRHEDCVHSVCFSPDGTKLASGSADNTIIIWDVLTGWAERIFVGHTDSIWSVCFSPDRKKLASGSEDKTIVIWDLATGRPETLRRHAGSIRSVCFSPDGKKLVSASGDKTIKLFKVI